MLQKYLLPTILLFVSVHSNCQDKIIQTDGKVIESKIIEINEKEVKYKKFNNLEGPLFIINKTSINEIWYSNGEKEHFSKTRSELKADYDLKEKNNINSIFQKGNKAFISNGKNANNDVIRYFKNALVTWNYWNIVDNIYEADFILELHFGKKKVTGDRFSKVILKTKNNIIFKESKNYTVVANAFNGYNPSRASVNKIVEKFLKENFK